MSPGLGCPQMPPHRDPRWSPTLGRPLCPQPEPPTPKQAGEVRYVPRPQQPLCSSPCAPSSPEDLTSPHASQETSLGAPFPPFPYSSSSYENEDCYEKQNPPHMQYLSICTGVALGGWRDTMSRPDSPAQPGCCLCCSVSCSFFFFFFFVPTSLALILTKA